MVLSAVRVEVSMAIDGGGSEGDGVGGEGEGGGDSRCDGGIE